MKAESPTPEEIIARRIQARLTQPKAAALVHSTVDAWSKWERPVGHYNHRAMHPGLWELFRIKTGRRIQARVKRSGTG